ncbi:M48 family metalloprotease [Allosalinactinospora lopnorensis]|uniref:hypothetical protein n=1 Tax=Allosalinactinospora lopnorensis TaxID=1352348 RepID=UPI00138F3286|nr:hypothetical protein [Allosalinactinospora lopnorensis]
MLLAREFYLPALRHLSERFVAGRELAADRRAITRCGTRPLAGALLRVLSPPAWAASPAAAMAGATTVDARITQLETGSEPPLPPIPRRSWLVSAMIAAVVLAGAANAALLVQQMCTGTM